MPSFVIQPLARIPLNQYSAARNMKWVAPPPQLVVGESINLCFNCKLERANNAWECRKGYLIVSVSVEYRKWMYKV